MRTGPKIALSVFLVLLAIALVTGITLYAMARHRPAGFREALRVSAADRQVHAAAFDRTLEEASNDFQRNGAFTKTFSAAELNAALERYGRDPQWRQQANIPPEIRQVQVALEPDRCTAYAVVPSDIGPVIISAAITVEPGRAGEPRLKVGDIRAGSLHVPAEWARKLAESIEAMKPVFQVDAMTHLRIVTLSLDEGRVTVTGRKEEL